MIYIFTIAWILYMIFEGVREAGFWRQNTFSSKPLPFNFHGLFLFQRLLVFILLTFCFIYTNPVLINTILYCSGIILISPFLHNGSYYQMRHYIDKEVYPKGWFDQSTTSTAFMTKLEKPIFRLIGFSVGLILITISLL